MLGRLSCKVQQIDLYEEWQLDTIVGKFAERQVEMHARHRQAAIVCIKLRSIFRHANNLVTNMTTFSIIQSLI